MIRMFRFIRLIRLIRLIRMVRMVRMIRVVYTAKKQTRVVYARSAWYSGSRVPSCEFWRSRAT